MEIATFFVKTENSVAEAPIETVSIERKTVYSNGLCVSDKQDNTSLSQTFYQREMRCFQPGNMKANNGSFKTCLIYMETKGAKSKRKNV